MTRAIFLVLLSGLWACGGDVDPAGADLPHLPDSSSGVPWTADGSSCDGLVPDVAVPPADLPLPSPDGDCSGLDLTGRFWRFTTFEVRQPAGPEGALAGTLTALWAGQIARGELNIYFRVLSHDRSSGTLEVEAGTAFHPPEDPSRMVPMADPAPGVLPLRMEGCVIRSRQVGTLHVFPDLLTVPLDILETSIVGLLSPDGSRIHAGTMVGGICRSMAEEQYFRLSGGSTGGCSNLAAFLDDLEVAPDRDDLWGCGGCPPLGWRFEGSFEAVANDRFAAEGGVPLRTFRCQ